MSAFDAILGDSELLDDTAGVPLAPRSRLQRPDLGEIFRLYAELKNIESRDRAADRPNDTRRDLVLSEFVNVTCATLRTIRMNEKTRGYILELRDETAMQMMEVLHRVCSFIRSLTQAADLSRSGSTSLRRHMTSAQPLFISSSR
jgi:hypothetical protein